MLHIAAADIGGTNSRFAHFSLRVEGAEAAQGGGLRLHRVVHCATESLRHTGDALAQAAATGLDPREAQAVVWAVAGPVRHALRAQLTNAAVDIDLSLLLPQQAPAPEHNLFAASSAQTPAAKPAVVCCINDFLAQAWAAVSLPGLEAVEILPAVEPCSGNATGDNATGDNATGVSETAVLGIVGAGTGLGTASLLSLGGGHYRALAAEGGHAAFPWRGRKEAEFGDFLCAALNLPYACGDQVLSGRGLALLHYFLTGKDWPVERVAAEALGPESATLRHFACFYGRLCRHWVLQTLCTGGLYLTGGVAVRNPRIVRSAAFAEEFYAAPPHIQPLLRATPVRLMTREHAGLWGAARLAQELLESVRR